MRFNEQREALMTIVLIVLLLALIFGGVGLFVEAATWALIVALILLVVGAVVGFGGRGRARI